MWRFRRQKTGIILHVINYDQMTKSTQAAIPAERQSVLARGSVEREKVILWCGVGKETPSVHRTTQSRRSKQCVMCGERKDRQPDRTARNFKRRPRATPSKLINQAEVALLCSTELLLLLLSLVSILAIQYSIPKYCRGKNQHDNSAPIPWLDRFHFIKGFMHRVKFLCGSEQPCPTT